MACSALPLEIESHQLTHCYYLSLHCGQHGDIRIAVENAPACALYPCPLCEAPCYCYILGRGGTARGPLPFWDEIPETISFEEANRRLWRTLGARVIAK
jgi:hypothetical protein